MGGGILERANRRHLWRHPWQLALAVLGVAVGVAVVVAVDLANASAERAFELAAHSLSGAATDQIIGGPAGLDQRLYTQLRVGAGIERSAPLVEGYGTAGGRTLHLIGIDPFAEAGLRDELRGVGAAPIRQLLLQPATVLMTAATARDLGIRPGDRFTLQLAGRSERLRLIGLLPPRQSPAMDGMLITDIASAQELLHYFGRLSWIDLRLPAGRSGERLRARVRELLPPGARLVRAGSRTQTLRNMTRAFRTNLTAMSLLALLVGMFLIYNTMTFAVLQRRGLLASLRALGVTRGQVFRVVVAEALLIGAVGTALGLLLGLALGQGLVHLVTRTINDLYFVVTVNRLLITPVPVIKGVLLGLGATAVAALAPAAEAAWTAPALALHRSGLEQRARRLTPRLAVAGALLVLGSAGVLLLPDRSIVTGFVALFMLVVGLTLATPLAVAGLTRAATPVVGRLFGIQGRLAVRGIHASLSRTGVAIAALMLAVSTTVGVAVMVDSFRASVDQWLHATLNADIYVRAPDVGSNRTDIHLEPDFVQRVRALPQVAGVSLGRRVTLETNRARTHVLALQPAPGHRPGSPLLAGKPDRVWPAFDAGRGVLVSEPYAYRHHIAVGDAVHLRTDHGRRTYRVLGIYRDYDSQQGIVLMPRAVYRRDFNDPAVSALGIYLNADADLNAALAAVKAAAGGAPVQVRSSRDIRRISLAIFDRTFTITNVLRLLAIVVAFIAILSALLALQLERTRELAILRATGFTPAQVGGLVGLQTGLMGLAAGILALPTGLALAAMLIHVINRRSFGWTVSTLVPPEILLQALALAVGAALLAGIYPGWRMARTSPAAALREE
ncbi:MAG: ABC transporter permease [Gammaproteobacteria bacterium]